MSFIRKLFKKQNSPNLQDLANSGAVIIDVRSESEFASGHVKGSKNIPLQTIGSKTAEIKAMNKPIIAVCASGIRSGNATRKLKKQGVEEIYNGGSWTNFSN